MKTNYYAIVNKNGNFITVDGRLPIFWNKEPAIRFQNRFFGYPKEGKVVPIKINELKKILTNE